MGPWNESVSDGLNPSALVGCALLPTETDDGAVGRALDCELEPSPEVNMASMVRFAQVPPCAFLCLQKPKKVETPGTTGQLSADGAVKKWCRAREG